MFDSVNVKDSKIISLWLSSDLDITKNPLAGIFLFSKYFFETSEPKLSAVAVFLCKYQPVKSTSDEPELYNSINLSSVDLI